MTSRAERIYAVLLGVLPAQFRAEAEADLLEVFTDARMRAARASWPARARFWCVMLLDLVLTAVSEWRGVLDARRRERAATSSRRRGVELVKHVMWSFRYLVRRPARSIVAAMTLALGIATTVVGIVLVRGVLLSPLPFPEAEQLVRLREVDERGRTWWPSMKNVVDWRAHGGELLQGVAAVDPPEPHPVLWSGQAQRLSVSGWSRGLLDVLRVRPALGRDFTDGENAPGGAAVAVVSWPMWRTQLGGLQLEQLSLTIGARQYQVVGVLPEDFRFFGEGGAWSTADVFLPLEQEELDPRTAHGYHTVARLRDGMTAAQAKPQLDALALRLRESHGEYTHAHSLMVTSVFDAVVGSVRTPLRLLLGAAVLVLLIACLNVGGTLLAEGIGRDRELAVRLAIGARRRDLLLQLVTESAALALPGAALGALLATGTLQWLHRLQSHALPRLENAIIDATTFGITVGVALLAAIIAGVVPALILSARDLGSRLRGSMGLTAARGTQRLWSGFIALQAALTLVLLFGGALLLRSMLAAISVPLGYTADDVLAVSVALPESRYADEAQRPAFYDALLEQVRALPGVTAAGMSSKLPQDAQDRTASTGRADSEESVFAAYRLVDPGYFDVLQVPTLTAGADARLAAGEGLVDEALARTLSPDGDVVGSIVWNGYQDGDIRVTGVVGAVREWSMAEGMPTVYVDYRTRPDQLMEMYVLLRVRGDMDAVAQDVRDVVGRIDPMVPIAVRPLPSYLSAQVADRRLILGLIGGFAAIALCLAGVAMYGMVAFVVGRRRREMGIRVSLGARPAEVVRETMRNGVRPAFIGLAAGLAAALMLGSVLESQLFGVAPRDPVALGLAAALLAVTALVASALPARAAARFDPVTVLRTDQGP